MKMLLVDDHPLERCALETLIQSLGCDVTVLSAASAEQAKRCLDDQGPVDLALVDLQLPDADGLSLLAQWRQSHPAMRVAVISASETVGEVMRALDAGAAGFIPKRTALELQLQALRMLMSGGVYVPAGALRQTMEPSAPSLQSMWWPSTRPVHTPAPPVSVPPNAGGLSQLKLTPRQSEVLQLLLQGQPNKLIARQLKLSVETVKDHVASLLRVLGVSSRTQAVLAVTHLMTPPSALGHNAHLPMRPPVSTYVHRSF